MYEYIKINADTYEVYKDSLLLGYIICDRLASSIRGYKVVINGEILGYGYGGYKKSLKEAKRTFEIEYEKFIKHLNKPDIYYAAELDMYFNDYGLYERFKTTPVYQERVLKSSGKK